MNKQIFFINPEDKILAKKGDRAPLGIGYLSSFAKSLNWQTKIFDLNHTTIENIYHNINTTKYSLEYICFSISTPTYNNAIKLAQKIKKFTNFKGKFVAGGNHITNLPNEKLTIETFDYLICGEGELGLKNLLLNPLSCSKVINSPPIQNLDTIPFPDYKGLKFEIYKFKLNRKKGAVIISSRGCPYGCSFCANKVKKWRGRSALNIVEEMKLLYNIYDIRGFFFGDDNVTYDRKRVFELCKLIQQEFEDDITLRITARADLLDKEMLIEMKKAGCDIVSLGIENGNDEVLRKNQKGMTTKQNEQVVELCKEVGIKVKAFFIFPLPFDTEETFNETLEFAKKLDLEYCDMYMFTPFPNTPIWQNPERYNIKILYPTNSNWQNFYQVSKSGYPKQQTFIHPNFTYERILELLDKFNKEIRGGNTYE